MEKKLTKTAKLLAPYGSVQQVAVATKVGDPKMKKAYMSAGKKA